MGTMTLPSSGLVYVDSMAVIYTVEQFPAYWPLLATLWQAAQSGTIEVVTSDLTLMETLVGPYKSGDRILEQAFEQALLGTTLRLLSITHTHSSRGGPAASRDETANAGRHSRSHGETIRLCLVCHQ
jgi:hypothetical protein